MAIADVNQEDAERWQQALSAYRYPVARDSIVRFAKRIDAAAPSFNFDLSSGTRGETIDFEQRFRSFGPKAIEPWFEVIFWKLASIRGRGESKAAEMIEGLKAINAQAPKLWSACENFVAASNKKSFEALQADLFIVTKSVPVAATFPSFMSPERFPMVDSWIAKWVIGYRAEHSAEAEGSGLAAPSESYLARRRTTFRLPGDWPFYEGWIEFCRMAASILTQQTGFSMARSRYRNGCVAERAFGIAAAPAHHMIMMNSERDFRILAKTLRSEFKTISLKRADGNLDYPVPDFGNHECPDDTSRPLEHAPPDLLR